MIELVSRGPLLGDGLVYEYKLLRRSYHFISLLGILLVLRES